MKVAKLINRNGYVDSCFCIREISDSSFRGTLFKIVAWNSGEETKIDYYGSLDFIANVYFKWDFCSHWYFNGEDFTGVDETKDSYYHLCGSLGIMDFIRSMLFVCKLTEQLIQGVANDEIEKIDFSLLDGYLIEFEEVDKEKIPF